MPAPYRRWSRLSRQYAPVVPSVTLTNTAEGGTNGVTLTQGSGGNTGGASGAPFDVVTIGANATLAFDSTIPAHGLLAYKVATGASNVTAYAQWSASMGPQPQAWFRLYLYFTAFPSAIQTVWRALQGSTTCGGVQVHTTGVLQFTNATGAAIFATTATIPLGTWFRIEGYLTGSPAAGQAELQLFRTADKLAADEVKTSAATQNTLGTPDTFRFGIGVSGTNFGPYWMDDLGLSNAGYLGPVPGNAPVYPLQRPVAARAVNLQPGTVRRAAGPYGQTGPPVRPLAGPVRARVPLGRGGHASGRTGAYGQPGPPVKAPPGPVRARVPQPPRGGQVQRRTGVFGGLGPAVRPAAGPVQARQPLPRRGVTASRAGTYTAVVTGTGPPVYPLGHPVQARRLPVAGGRVVRRAGTYQGTGPSPVLLRQPAGVARQQPPPPARGRTASQRGPYSGTGPPAIPLRRPVRGRLPGPVLTGRARTTLLPPVTVPPPALHNAASALLVTSPDTSAATVTEPRATAAGARSPHTGSIYTATYQGTYPPDPAPPGPQATGTPGTGTVTEQGATKPGVSDG